MERSIMFIFFIKISMFILLNSICHFYNNLSTFNKFFEEKFDFGRKLDTRIHRLLGNCEKDICPNVGTLKEKNEKLYRILLYKEKLIKTLMKNKCTMLHKSYNHYEKKIMNGLNDKAFFKKMILINDIDYKQLKRKKYGLRIVLLLLLFLLVLTLPILDLSLGKFETLGNLLNLLCQLVSETPSNSQSPSLTRGSDNLAFSICDGSNITETYKAVGVLIYCLPIIIMGIILILGIFYYYKNVIKHKKIKFLEIFNEW
ncbi:hypothetical protein MKS88_002208 [Plasmodium brasilianum]|uniref:Uncharacterized protein n=1 Tax=Plasmodium brasilianum TaxID=5824 RepID=A0ACB9Y9D7_PLABR|nr:hypothetical protein MKS88_002208 [Plasmodium brasilianum]